MFKLSTMKMRAGLVVLVAMAMILPGFFAPTQVLAAATTPSLGAAGSFSVLAALSASAAAAGTTTSGDLGLSPGLAVSRTGNWNVLGSEYFGPLSLAAAAQTDALIAFNDLAGQSSNGPWGTPSWSPVPGVWTAASDKTFTGTITLNGTANDVWVFQVGRDMTFSGSVILAGTAQPCHVFWQIGRSATIASGSAFVGTLIASADITLVSGATVNGRIISLFGALTTDGNTITTPPVCASAAHLSLTKLVSPATYNVGGVLSYILVATNDGNTTLTGVSISDNPGLTGIVSNLTQPATLAPGAKLIVTGNHTIDSGDLAAGFFTNTATASGTGVPAATATTTAWEFQNSPHLSLTKSVTPTIYSKIGDILTFILIATNNGNSTLGSVSINDTELDIILSNPAQGSPLSQNATMTVTGTHTITQADLVNGSFKNTANASGTPPGAPAVSANATSESFRAPSVGGEVNAINKGRVLAPWLGLGLVLVLAGTVLTVLLLRRRISR